MKKIFVILFILVSLVIFWNYKYLLFGYEKINGKIVSNNWNLFYYPSVGTEVYFSVERFENCIAKAEEIYKSGGKIVGVPSTPSSTYICASKCEESWEGVGIGTCVEKLNLKCGDAACKIN